MKKPPKDVNSLAHFIVGEATKEPTEQELRSAAAKIIGRLGGLKGGRARAKALSAKRRKEIAKKAITARWAKH